MNFKSIKDRLENITTSPAWLIYVTISYIFMILLLVFKISEETGTWTTAAFIIIIIEMLAFRQQSHIAQLKMKVTRQRILSLLVEIKEHINVK